LTLTFATQELREQGVRVKLPQQSFQILQMLLERPGELVSRDELRQALWPADTFVDFDHGLNNSVKRIRDALGDSADTPRYIETLPRLGYRFIGDIDVAPAPVLLSQAPGKVFCRPAGNGAFSFYYWSSLWFWPVLRAGGSFHWQRSLCLLCRSWRSSP